jgi:acetyl-CoA carboxylase biotin carboxyl carrier protein
MESKRTASSIEPHGEAALEKANDTAEVMSIAQIQGLVKLLDGSDVSELEIKRASEGVHLVLRKAKAPEGVVSDGAVPEGKLAQALPGNGALTTGETSNSAAHRHAVVAPLVGIFHPWLKRGGGTLVAVGDHVKVGQLVGTIESLNVFNEVETTKAGRVVEIHAQDGQPVEYGQVLVTIDTSEAGGA